MPADVKQVSSSPAVDVKEAAPTPAPAAAAVVVAPVAPVANPRRQPESKHTYEDLKTNKWKAQLDLGVVVLVGPVIGKCTSNSVRILAGKALLSWMRMSTQVSIIYTKYSIYVEI